MKPTELSLKYKIITFPPKDNATWTDGEGKEGLIIYHHIRVSVQN